MAIYESVCKKCGRVHEYIAKIADRGNTPICCNRKTVQQLTAVMTGAMVWTHAKGFHGPDGSWVSDGAKFKKYMKDNNLVSGTESDAMVKQAHKRRADEHAKSVEKTVEAVVRQANIKD